MPRISIHGVFYPSPGERLPGTDPTLAPVRARLLLRDLEFRGRAEILLVDDHNASIEADGDFYPSAPPGPPMRL